MQCSKMGLVTTLAVFLALVHAVRLQAAVICPNSTYVLGPNSDYCYDYVATEMTWFEANRTCQRSALGGSLLSITSQDENTYVNDNYFASGTEFWIGLNDLEDEGTFRWALGDPLGGYDAWSPAFPSDNGLPLDCVKFASDGWRVHNLYCGTGKLSFVCKVAACDSNDGFYCIGQEPVVSSPVSIGLIVGVVLGVVLFFIIVAIVIFLVWLWKFHNDVFYRYVCCCAKGGSRSAVHSLQQENQRLRHEISQHKLSFSGRYTQGQFAHELSGVPDGRGGTLPTIRQPFPSSPTVEDRTLPTPLGYQRSGSRVIPIASTPSRLPLTPSVFTPSGGWPIRSIATLGSMAPPLRPPGKVLSKPPLSPIGEVKPSHVPGKEEKEEEEETERKEEGEEREKKEERKEEGERGEEGKENDKEQGGSDQDTSGSSSSGSDKEEEEDKVPS